jgi:crotonyl-CoA carboxylase/reductase
MYAQVIRQDRFGDPKQAFEVESVPVPTLRAGEVLVAVMASGINYNNVWAARGTPVDVIANRQRAGEPYDFHIGGSDASGVVYAVAEASTALPWVTRSWSIPATGMRQIHGCRAGATR